MRPPQVVLGLCGYVVGSSALGLALPIALGGPAAALKIWSVSPGAEFVFVTGSCVAAVAGHRLARDVSFLLGAAAALAVSWITYTLSFASIAGQFEAASDSAGFGEVFWFVGRVGFPGLVFAAFAPAAAGLWDARQGRLAPKTKESAAT